MTELFTLKKPATRNNRDTETISTESGIRTTTENTSAKRWLQGKKKKRYERLTTVRTREITTVSKELFIFGKVVLIWSLTSGMLTI